MDIETAKDIIKKEALLMMRGRANKNFNFECSEDIYDLFFEDNGRSSVVSVAEDNRHCDWSDSDYDMVLKLNHPEHGTGYLAYKCPHTQEGDPHRDRCEAVMVRPAKVSKTIFKEI